MAMVSSSTFLPCLSRCSNARKNSRFLPNLSRFKSVQVRAAKLPAGVVIPKVEPKLTEPFLGFTRTAETWNSRACMIGIIGTFFLELVLHKGLLQIIGVEVGKGLDLPL